MLKLVFFFFFLFSIILLAYKIRSCKIISLSQHKTKREKEWLLLEIKISSNVCFLNQLLIVCLILVLYVYVLLEIYRRLLWLMIFIVFYFFFFFSLFVGSKCNTWKNCLAAFCPTVYGQNQVKKRLYHHTVSHMIMGRERKDKLGMILLFVQKKGMSLIYNLWGF